jgi:hypothetical protein
MTTKLRHTPKDKKSKLPKKYVAGLTPKQKEKQIKEIQKSKELYKKTGRLETHRLEPFGPFGLTEWVKANNINFTHFPQETLLDHNGFLGVHHQKSTWKL